MEDLVISPRTLIFSLLLAITISAPMYATNYYVTQSGSGSKDGSSLANAWSLATYNSSSQPSGGDTVFFSGTITSTVVPNTSGSSGKVLTLDFSSATVAPPAVSLNGRNYITMVGGAVSGGQDGSAIVNCASASSNISLSGFTFTAPTSSGTNDFVVATRGCDNWTVSRNSMKYVCHGVAFDGGPISNWDIADNLFVTNNTITNCQSDLLFLPDASHITIEGNKLIEQAPGQSSCCHNDAIQTFKSGASGAVNPSDFIIRYNWIERNVPAGGSGDNSWMEIENMTGQPAMRIYSNVFVGNGPSIGGGNGISIHSGTSSSDTYFFYNNTIYRHQQPNNAIRLGEGDGPGKVYWENNLAAQDAACNCQMTQVAFSIAVADHNFFSSDWDGCSSSFSGPHGSCSAVSSFVNSGSNEFSLQSGSQLVGAGDSNIGAEFNRGIAPGASWPNPELVTRSSGFWDVGAFQANGGTSSSPTAPSGLTAIVE